MLLNAFTREVGTRQGRIAPTGVTPVQSTHVFCLGIDGTDAYDVMTPGDFVQVEQEATFTPGTKLFRVTAQVRPPAVIPNGYKWVFQILVDDVVLVEHRLVAGDVTRTRAFALNVSKLAAGDHIVTMRLRFLTDDNTSYIVMASSECGP